MGPPLLSACEDTMNRRGFLRGLVAAPLVAVAASVPVPAQAAPMALDEDRDEWPWCEACRSWHKPGNPTCVTVVPEPPKDTWLELERERQYMRILRERAQSDPALLRAVVMRALENR